MSKRSNVDQLEAEIAEAYQANESAAAAADDAREAYHAAVAKGDMDAAQAHRAEAARQDAEARTYADRVDALKAKRPEAKRKDTQGDYKAACGELQEATKAVQTARDRAAAAAAEYHAAVMALDTEAKRYRSALSRVEGMAKDGGHDLPEVIRPSIRLGVDVIDAARRHDRIGGDLSQFITRRQVPAKGEAA